MPIQEKLLDGATFEVFRITGETSGQNGKLICTVTTDHSGVVVITGLEAGAYAVRETKAPNHYIIAEADMQTVNLKPDGTSVVEVVFRNYPYGNISIQKSRWGNQTAIGRCCIYGNNRRWCIGRRPNIHNRYKRKYIRYETLPPVPMW